MQRKIVPDIIGEQTLTALTRSATVREAAELMLERNIGAILVIEDDRLQGIFTERDLTTRVAATGRNPDTTQLGEVMTGDLDTVSPNDTAASVLELMQEHGYRHVPVLDGDQVVGIVSIRDLYAAVKRQLEEDIKEREAFIFGSNYGAGA